MNNTTSKKCPYCQKDNSISSNRCECGFFFDQAVYQEQPKEPVYQPFYLNKKFATPLKYVVLIYRILFFCVAIFFFGFGVLVLLSGGIAEPFPRDSLFWFGLIMSIPMIVFIISELIIKKIKSDIRN